MNNLASSSRNKTAASQFAMKSFRALSSQIKVLALLCTGLMTFAIGALAQNVFVPTGSMTTARATHTATLLNNGQVLIAGGLTNNGSELVAVASAELYDPATGTFTATGSMTTVRTEHTATFLNNGQVLIVGGYNATTTLASAELYDPATGTFTATGSMTTARAYHTSTLLNNGKVLVAGGNTATGGTLASAELYDPATGTFTATGSMTTARAYHTSTLLNNGQVLVAGANSGGTTLDSAELYDPATGTFTVTGSMHFPVGLQTATLLNSGNVLVAGGLYQGQSSPGSELYNFAAETFTLNNNPMHNPRYSHTATLLNNGNVVVAGGWDVTSLPDVHNALATADLYDPATGIFTATGSMSSARYLHTATLLNNGMVLVAGGTPNQSNALASADLFEPVLQVVVFPTSLSFSNQPAGTASAAQTVTLTNGESTALSITSIAFGGTNASDFAETDNCLGSVPVGATCSINVSFTPAAAGTRTGTLNIADNATNPPSPQTVTLTGTGVTVNRIATTSASSLTFTSQTVGTTSTAQGFTLSNTGNVALTLSSLTFSGTNGSDFAESDNCGSSIAAGASCTINITFVPAATGARTGTLNITDNATSPPSPQTVTLTGTGIPPAPIVSLSTMSVAFATQSFGTTSAAQTVTVRNTGFANLSIQTVALAGANPGDFAIANGTTCVNGASVVPNSSCTIQLTFTPTAIGTHSASVFITDNAGDSPETISLSGTTAPTPLVSVTPSNISFSNQYAGTSGLPQSVTVTNNGNGPLSIVSTATSVADFGQLTACGSSLAAGSSCAIGVFFDPTGGGTRTGTLTITDNAPGSPQTVALSGVGQDFSVTPTSSQAATVTPGQTASYSLTISSSGGFNQSVTLACSGAPSPSTCAVSPSSVALNGSTSATAMVTVTTMAASLPATTPSAKDGGYQPPYLITELLGLLLLTGMLAWHRGRNPRLAGGLALLSLMCAGMMMSSCGGGGSGSGGGGNQGTPAGTYSLVVTGTFASGSNALTHNSNLTLVVQ